MAALLGGYVCYIDQPLWPPDPETLIGPLFSSIISRTNFYFKDKFYPLLVKEDASKERLDLNI